MKRRVHRFSQDLKEHRREHWVEHDIVDAELELKRPAPAAILLTRRPI
jgi:hypothetical protein